jgi:hypothetical protein
MANPMVVSLSAVITATQSERIAADLLGTGLLTISSLGRAKPVVLCAHVVRLWPMSGRLVIPVGYLRAPRHTGRSQVYAWRSVEQRSLITASTGCGET